MKANREWIIKGIALAVWAGVLVSSGIAFAQHRQYKEAVVLGAGVVDVRTLGDYFEPLKGTTNDCNIYILDSGVPGGTLLIMGAVHAEEPATNLAAQLIVENASATTGRIIVAIHENRSGSTVTRPGDAYPQFFTIETDWGEKKFRMGDRWANPLDSWPDPETYVHYPSGQLLAYMDVRNMNRTWPGRPNGSLAERTSYAFMRLIEEEGVDLTIDLHEAELEYPIIGTIVAHQGALDVAAMVSMMLTAQEFTIGMEISPLALHGLSHREIGDFSDSPCILLEAPEPFLDRVRGVTDEALLLTGQDEFVMKAGEHGLLYWPIDENGWPIDIRVARHVRTIEKITELWTRFHPDEAMVVAGFPTYNEMVELGVGHFFHDPSTVSQDRVAFE
ncbi:succinylglutamate desuccinylase/aspartoacylase family protein [Candidatus Bipolaricaulota bacterium]|nr:succinylglutamate desuccinylase/aspartoacylase family protein [Candidatus Bipolaricaulota bacterium]